MMTTKNGGGMFVQEQCIIEGCTRLQGAKGKLDGRQMYTLRCRFHRHALDGNKWRSLKWKPQQHWPCEQCGWKEASRDKHRIVPGREGGTYRRDNVVILCPNCHRLAEEGKLTRDELARLVLARGSAEEPAAVS